MHKYIASGINKQPYMILVIRDSQLVMEFIKQVARPLKSLLVLVPCELHELEIQILVQVVYSKVP